MPKPTNNQPKTSDGGSPKPARSVPTQLHETASLPTAPIGTDRRQQSVDEARARGEARRAPVSVRIEENEDGGVHKVIPGHSDAEGWETQFLDAFGTLSVDFAKLELVRIQRALNILHERYAGAREGITNGALAVLAGVRPRDEIEAMLASQMATTHALAMEMLTRANTASDAARTEGAGNLEVKHLRTFTTQTEALAKLRRGGEQTVRVEHVHVYPGGQAVVGNVTQAGRDASGGGHKI